LFSGLGGLGERSEIGGQPLGIVIEPPTERRPGAFGAPNGLGLGQAFGMLLHSFRTEQLGANGHVAIAVELDMQQ
jgi:hypothetical protein